MGMLSTDQEEVLRRVIDVLDRLSATYCIVGSVAGAFHGVIRETHDADIVFDAARIELPRALADALGPSAYVDVPEDGMRQFNIIDDASAYKIDFWPIGHTPFERAQLKRRIRHTAFDRDVWFASIEDLILSKLRWHAQSGSELQWRDLTLLVGLHRDDVDRAYLERWADALDLRTHLDRLWTPPPS